MKPCLAPPRVPSLTSMTQEAMPPIEAKHGVHTVDHRNEFTASEGLDSVIELLVKTRQPCR